MAAQACPSATRAVEMDTRTTIALGMVARACPSVAKALAVAGKLCSSQFTRHGRSGAPVALQNGYHCRRFFHILEVGGESSQEVVSFCFVRACGRTRGLVAQWSSNPKVVDLFRFPFSPGAPSIFPCVSDV